MKIIQLFRLHFKVYLYFESFTHILFLLYVFVFPLAILFYRYTIRSRRLTLTNICFKGKYLITIHLLSIWKDGRIYTDVNKQLSWLWVMEFLMSNYCVSGIWRNKSKTLRTEWKSDESFPKKSSKRCGKRRYPNWQRKPIFCWGK